MVIVRKLETSTSDNGDVVAKDFDVSEIVLKYTDGYWFNKEESKIEVTPSGIFLVLVFLKKAEDKREPTNIEDLFPKYKVG